MDDKPIPTSPTYCVAADVATERREAPYTEQEAGPEEGRRPTLSQLNTRIMRWEDWIDRHCRHAWRQRRVTNLRDDLFIGALKFGNRWDHNQRLYDNWWSAKLPHRMLRPFVSGTHKITIFTGGQDRDLVATGTENRVGGTHWIEHDIGVIHIRRGLVLLKDRRFGATYDYGESNVPGPIATACAYLVAAELEISQPGRAPDRDADKIRSSSRYDYWWREAHRLLDRFVEPAVM